MAYSTANPPILSSQSVNGARIFTYKSADPITTVRASGYFSDGQRRGLKVGDILLIQDTVTPASHLAYVASVNAITGSIDTTDGLEIVSSTPLALGSRILVLGDSNNHYNHYVTQSPIEVSRSWRGPMSWLHAVNPRFTWLTWRDLTANYGPYTSGTATTPALGSNPFATTNASATVTVTHTGHGMTVGSPNGAEYVFAGASTFNNVTMNGRYTVQTVPTANTFTVTAGTTANNTGSGGGASVTFNRRLGATVSRWMLGLNRGTASEHSEGILDLVQVGNGFLTSGAVLSELFDFWILSIGTNDINSSDSAATTFANIQSIVNILKALNKPGIVTTVPPRGLVRTSTLATDPLTTTNASNLITVSHPGHDFDVGQNVTFAGAANVGGLTITGPYAIQSTGFHADAYVVAHGSNATSSATGGGSSVTATNTSANLVYPYDDARWTQLRNLNNSIRNESWGPLVTVANIDTVMLDGSRITDGASGTGAALPYRLIDGVHFTPRGASEIAIDVLNPIINTKFAAGSVHQEDPTVAGNIIRRAGTLGTAGTASTGVTGNVADNWIAQRSTGSGLTIAAAKIAGGTGYEKSQFTFTSVAGPTTPDVFQFRPSNMLAYNRVATAATITVNVQTSGANPTVQITHNTVTNGHPVPGGQVTFANVSATTNGVDITGTWTIASVSDSANSNAVFTFVATGQTASGTGSASRTADVTYLLTNLLPQDTWIQFGAFFDVGAWSMWRDIQVFMQTRNGSSAVATYRVGRVYNSSMRYSIPNRTMTLKLVSDPIQLTAADLASVTNLYFSTQIAVENATGSPTTAIISVWNPFLRVVADPR